jgi:hypothetical protein
MKDLDNSIYLTLYIISNMVALLMFWAGWKNPRLLRLLLCLVFVWASWTNWNESSVAPQFYLDYSAVTFSDLYRHFINGWFSTHIMLAVGFIAICQSLIALSMLLKAWLFKTGAIGAIIFLLAIAPLGFGSAFPCTLILAASVCLLLRKKEINYLWRSPVKRFAA